MRIGESGFDNLLKKNIEECFINPQHDVMIWRVNGELYEISAEGECCSYSWFEHCDDVSILKNSTLLDYESIGAGDLSPEEDSPNRVISVNLLKFKTDKGRCTIEFRNSSNGYYSGYAAIKKIDSIPSDFVPMIQDF